MYGEVRLAVLIELRTSDVLYLAMFRVVGLIYRIVRLTYFAKCSIGAWGSYVTYMARKQVGGEGVLAPLTPRRRGDVPPTFR